jgi:hypothetical protein
MVPIFYFASFQTISMFDVIFSRKKSAI